jgi:tRNA pseudouridine38-40 synthase
LNLLLPAVLSAIVPTRCDSDRDAIRLISALVLECDPLIAEFLKISISKMTEGGLENAPQIGPKAKSYSESGTQETTSRFLELKEKHISRRSSYNADRTGLCAPEAYHRGAETCSPANQNFVEAIQYIRPVSARLPISIRETDTFLATWRFGTWILSTTRSSLDDMTAGIDSKERSTGTRNLKLILSYDGAEFSGWQVQPDAATVQGTLASAIGRITGEKVLPQGSGRTDAGVHALAQVVTFVTESSVPTANFVKALNDILPASMRVLEVSEAPPDFHARHSARAKTYRYRIYREDICPPFLARYVWHYPYPLDESAMTVAAEFVIGEHDFTSFAVVDPERGRGGEAASNVRTIFASSWERAADEWIYRVRGSGFLHHMVRNLVGTFILVGKGTLRVEDVTRILEARSRSAAGPTAPASGLYLVSVEY